MAWKRTKGASGLGSRGSDTTAALRVQIIGAILYVDGHGIHLAANSIGHEDLTGDAKDVTHFWDEEWGHGEWHRVPTGAWGAGRGEFTTALHLQRALAFELILAWRLLLLVKLGRARPDLPASSCFDADELAVLQRSKKTPSPAALGAATGDSPGRRAGRLGERRQCRPPGRPTGRGGSGAAVVVPVGPDLHA